jgi:homoserine O-acetyltransferase
MVRAQNSLVEHLGITRLRGVVGGSIGGMQALQWAVEFPERVARVVAIGAAPLGAMGLAFNQMQRQAITGDPLWLGGRYAPEHPPAAGLALARALAMCTYKSPELFAERFARDTNRGGEDPHRSLHERYEIGGYLDYQGARFVERFDANSYLLLTKAMDNFDLARGYASEAEALRRITAAVTLVGISSDWLFPP